MPARVIFLGEALAPVAHGARQALTRKLRLLGHEFDTLEDSSRHLGVIQQALTRLKPRLDALAKILLRPTEVPNEASSGVVQSDPSAPELLGAMGALAFGVGLAEAVLGRKHG